MSCVIMSGLSSSSQDFIKVVVNGLTYTSPTKLYLISTTSNDLNTIFVVTKDGTNPILGALTDATSPSTIASGYYRVFFVNYMYGGPNVDIIISTPGQTDTKLSSNVALGDGYVLDGAAKTTAGTGGTMKFVSTGTTKVITSVNINGNFMPTSGMAFYYVATGISGSSSFPPVAWSVPTAASASGAGVLQAPLAFTFVLAAFMYAVLN